MGGIGLALLFSALTALLGMIGIAAAQHGRWVVALPALVLAGWMASMAWAVGKGLRR
ncbi:MAG: hypothetical protein WCH31_04190 [Actinomycetes bacterium]